MNFTASHRWTLALAIAGFIAALILTFIVSNRTSPEADVTHYRKAEVAREFVDEMISEPGEEIEPFLMRVAPMLASFTERTGFEACGVIAKNAQEDRLGVRIYTTRGRLTCTTSRAEVPVGMFALVPTIHSHPQRGITLPSETDLRLSEALVNKRGGKALLRRPTVIGRDTFSDTDYAAGPGYVISRGSLYHQNGEGTDRLIGVIDANQTASSK